jgi:hypothetical protein
MSWLVDVRDAIAGNHADYTQGSLERAITLLAVPMVLEMGMESVFGAPSTCTSYRARGRTPSPRSGVTESLLTDLVRASRSGLSMATTAMVSRADRREEPGRRGARPRAGRSRSASWCRGDRRHRRARSRRAALADGRAAAVIESGCGYTAWMLGGNVASCCCS